jgi:hypothetical protein
MRENSHVLFFYNSQDIITYLYIRKGILILSFRVYTLRSLNNFMTINL